MTKTLLLLALLLPASLMAEERLSNEEWLDALLRAEQAQNARPASDALLPFSQDGHPAPLSLPFMPLPPDWRLVESRLGGGEETWVWQQKWGRAQRRLTLTRAPVVADKPLAVRHSLHHNSTLLRCLDAEEKPVQRDSVDGLRRWQWQAQCRKKHGGRLTQQFLLLRGDHHRYDLVMEWHDKAPGDTERQRWRHRFESVRPCKDGQNCLAGN